MNDRIEVLRELDELVEAARLLGATQAKKGFGCYTDEDSRFERAMHESIAKHRAAIAAKQPAAEQDCDNCGGFGDVSGEYPGDACPDCRGTGKVPAQQPAAAGEEILVNSVHGVFILPLQPSGLLSGPRFVVHVPAQPFPAPSL